MRAPRLMLQGTYYLPPTQVPGKTIQEPPRVFASDRI